MTPTIKPKRDYRGHPLFSYGFRPFFLLSAIWAAIAIPLWIASHSLGPGAMSVNAGIVFHVHEMCLATVVPCWLASCSPQFPVGQDVVPFAEVRSSCSFCCGPLAGSQWFWEPSRSGS